MLATEPEFEPTDYRDGNHSADQGAGGSRPEHERDGSGSQVHAQPDPAHVRQLPVAPRRQHLDERIKQYIVDLVFATRASSRESSKPR